MVSEVRYKGQTVDPKDIQITWSNRCGEIKNGSIEDYGYSEWFDAWAECEAAEELVSFDSYV